MECTPTTRGEQQPTTTIWDAWNDVPADEPAVFVIDTKAIDEGRDPTFGWIKWDTGPNEFTIRMRELLGREPEVETWAIVDQSRCGPIMIPESFDPEDFDQVRREVQEAAA